MTHRAALIPVFAASLLAVMVAAPASAQGAPTRECSAEDIRQALAGDYAGPPCRFTQMPDDVAPAVESRPAPQLAGASPRPAQRAPATALTPSRAPRSGRSAPMVPAAQSARPAGPARSAPAGEPVRLDDTFFQGGLVGGVGRAPAIQYGYRGIIVIDAAGRAGVLSVGQVTSAPVMRMQARGAMRRQLVGQ
ncbi:hypothetical protein [Maricaulis maris]|uniref:hypothetical protein n=1 Tax=Maricaulis maris TaxID=74318 RepID=UPI000EB43B7B|nr:hypothetical protein [Maricaulis maris]